MVRAKDAKPAIPQLLDLLLGGEVVGKGRGRQERDGQSVLLRQPDGNGCRPFMFRLVASQLLQRTALAA
jgi:hypothetical protein